MSIEYFLSHLLQGKRRYISRQEVKKAHAPHIDGLTLADILIFCRQYPIILEYLPDEEEITRPGREFICNVAFTIEPEAFTAFVRSKEQVRRQKLDDMQRNQV